MAAVSVNRAMTSMGVVLSVISVMFYVALYAPVVDIYQQIKDAAAPPEA